MTYKLGPQTVCYKLEILQTYLSDGAQWVASSSRIADLFRWVENGFQKFTYFFVSMSESQLREQKEKDAKRWSLGPSLLPTI